MLRIREVAQPDTAPAEGIPRPSAAASAAAASAEIIRDFDDPYLEVLGRGRGRTRRRSDRRVDNRRCCRRGDRTARGLTQGRRGPRRLLPVLPEAEDAPADAVTDELTTGGVVAEATAQPVDSPTADAVLDDLPPVLPEAEDVPADEADRRVGGRGRDRRGDRTACQPVRATGPIGLRRDVDRRAGQQAGLPRDRRPSGPAGVGDGAR